jgi:mannitol-1-phosphate 5-dehydrogenase
VIGAGRIGCGFAGRLLHRSGYAVTLVSRPPVTALLSRCGGYGVRLADGDTEREERVEGVTALDAAQVAEIAAAISDAELVCTAVGAGNLDAVTPLLARGLAMAARPVNVIAFENAEDAGPRLRRLVCGQLGAGHAAQHGYSGAVVSAAVAHRMLGDGVLLVGEPRTGFVVDARALRDPLPAVEGLVAVDDFTAHYRSKLYRYSAGHAAAAYLGGLKGYRYLHAAVRDPEVRAAVRSAMAEGRAGLAAAYGDRIAGDEAELDTILDRFGNAALGDTVARVGRDVARKLGHRERLVGAALHAERAGVVPARLAQACAAAICVAGIGPPARVSGEPARRYRPSNLPEVLHRWAGLPWGSPLAHRIETAWLGLGDGWEQGNHLLRLDRPMWAWTGAEGPDVLPRAS